LMGGSKCKQYGVILREGWGLPLGTDDIAPPQIVAEFKRPLLREGQKSALSQVY
jgi:hypothetical protein